jgi:hypothetical protein
VLPAIRHLFLSSFYIELSLFISSSILSVLQNFIMRKILCPKNFVKKTVLFFLEHSIYLKKTLYETSKLHTYFILPSKIKVKVKLSLCSFNWLWRYDGVLGSGGIVPRILNLGTMWGRAGLTQWYSAGLRADRGFESRQGLGIFLFATASRPALELTQPPVQWVPGFFPLGVKRTTHLRVVPRSRMREVTPPLPKTPS